MLARAGSEIDDPVGGFHRVFVVLDDEHGVAQIAHRLQRLDQARLIARMQADAGFVEHVQHARQARSDLRGETNALRFAAREGRGGPIEREIVQAHIDHELQARADLFDDLFGDRHLAGSQRRAPVAAIVQRMTADCHPPGP